MSSLKLKCVTGFGDKVSPVSEILKSQGWPVPPRPPHYGRPCSCCSLWGQSPLKNASNPAATRVSITMLTPSSPATSKRRVCAPRVRTGQSVSAAQVAWTERWVQCLIQPIFIKLFTNFSDPPKRNRHLCPPPTPCNCER